MADRINRLPPEGEPGYRKEGEQPAPVESLTPAEKQQEKGVAESKEVALVPKGETEKNIAAEKTKAIVATGASNTVSQVLQRISGYQAANSLAPSTPTDPASFAAILKSASNANPDDALTWQATLLLKILRVIAGIK